MVLHKKKSFSIYASIHANCQCYVSMHSLEEAVAQDVDEDCCVDHLPAHKRRLVQGRTQHTEKVVESATGVLQEGSEAGGIVTLYHLIPQEDVNL